MSFKICNLRFIDSLQILACGLETLVNNLHGNTEENKYDSFNAINSISPDDYGILCRKGFYPYEWVDNLSKLDHEGLPPFEDFYSMLYQK